MHSAETAFGRFFVAWIPRVAPSGHNRGMRRRLLPPDTSVNDLEQAFYDALQRADVEAVMACWADEDDPVCVHPGGGRAVGLLAIRESFSRLLAAGAIRVQPTHVKQTMVGRCCVHSVLEQVDGVTNDGSRRAYVTATNVYVKTAQGWRMLAHHASPGHAGEVADPLAEAKVLH